MSLTGEQQKLFSIVSLMAIGSPGLLGNEDSMRKKSFASKSKPVTTGGSMPRRNVRGVIATAVGLFRRERSSGETKSMGPATTISSSTMPNRDQPPLGENQVSSFLHKVILDLVQEDSGLPQNAGDFLAAQRTSDGNNGDRPQASTAPQNGVADHIPPWKRAIDLAFIVLTFPCWLPVMVLIMGWVKLVSPGPVFYRQERVGYWQKRFMIFKFRTMHVNVETETHEIHFAQLMQTDRPMTKLDSAGDPRLIRFAGFLRAAGLDELPQLFNVLRGEMSLVGPRPCTPREFQRYQPCQHERFQAPPGMTGYWQVNGKNKTTFSEMIAMDILYARNMSVRLDLLILAKTVPAVISQVTDARVPAATKQSKPADGRKAPAVSWNFQ